MKKLTTKRGITYSWNEFWDIIIRPASETKSGKIQLIFKEGSREYERLSAMKGWVDET